MTLNIYQVDAFAGALFKGNPAAVIPLTEWLSTELMQQIALENNLSETVFFVPRQGEIIINASPNPLVIDSPVTQSTPEYDIRWFTPAVEINLCGHATLATAYVLFNLLDHPTDTIVFYSQSGPLTVTKNGDDITLDFPHWEPAAVEAPAALQQLLGDIQVLATAQYRDLLVELPDEAAVQNFQPDFSLMRKHFDKLIITAPGNEVDFVSRFFGPGAGVDEDPVTGSAHSQLIPYWSKKLGKTKLTARQLSARGGELICEDLGERVLMGGRGILYLKGQIFI